MPGRSFELSSKPSSLGSYYFRMYQMICEQERLVSQKEALWKRQGQIQERVDELDREMKKFEDLLTEKRKFLVRKNLNSKPKGF